ncbi:MULTISPECIES: family 20 glycosylhydrolase [unclassified Nocardioides]|uniref:family 20 glycosylhydrolase n=1 Tax=unclassified Nocardioides TaxID=2615069 RepID=UPI003621AD38
MAATPPAATTGQSGMLAPTGPPATSSADPVTVPAMQTWERGGADFVLPAGLVWIEIDGRYAAELRDDAETFQSDLRTLTGRRVMVRVSRDGRPGGDGGVGTASIRMTLDPGDDTRGPEQYTMTVDRAITLSGATPDGVFAATRSVLQLLRQSDRIPGGSATDWPAYPERSLMVDVGRKYFTTQWMRRQIRELSYLKFNQVRWHITDNQGFRIESRTHPEVVSPEHWTRQQVRDLVAYAAKYHVEVIPEFEMPGHMQFALREHPELQVVDRNGNRNPNNLDPTNPAARAFVKDLLDELVPLFDGRYIHTGGDEFTSDWAAYPVLTDWARAHYGPEANAHDSVLDFTNFLDDIVRSHGKTMRIWNDGAQGGAVVEANRDIVLEYWSIQHGSVRAQEFLDAGYQLVNANRGVLYDVPGVTPDYNNLDPRVIYDQWDMSQWPDALGPNLTDPHAPGILGGQLHVWNDLPGAMTEDQQAGRLAMPLRAMTEHLWDSNRAAASWDALAAHAFAVGHEPHWDHELASATGNLALGRLAWSSSRELRHCHEAALVDGDPATRWCGPKTAPQSVVVDLGRSVDLSTVVLRWETAYAKGYSIEVSDDRRAWRIFATTSTSDGGLDVLRARGHGRYLRLSMTERGTTYGYSLYEMEVYGPDSLVPVEFTVDAGPPAVIVGQDRAPARATLSVRNDSPEPATLVWSADPPPGIAVEPSSGVLQVGAGQTVVADLALSGQVSDPGSVQINVAGREQGDLVPLAKDTIGVSVPLETLAEAFTNIGITSDDNINPPGLGAGFGGAGTSYSFQALAAAGLTPGEVVTVSGVDLTWPDVAPGERGNVLANGQSFSLRGQGSTVGVLAASTYGPVTNDWVVHYADGTSQVVRARTPDWAATPPAGSVRVAEMPYQNIVPTGQRARRTYVFFVGLPVDPKKQVEAVSLPRVSAVVQQGVPALHVFALGIA